MTTVPTEPLLVSGQQAAVTVLFADICGSTPLFEKYGDLRARQIESRVLDLLAAETVACDGHVIKTIGDELVVNQEMVSRSHVDIEFRQGKFILIDPSTHGTYLLLDNGVCFFIHWEEFTLQSRGMLCLGRSVSNDYPGLIRYACGHL